ncbi:MAG: DUF1801 domain-containing protein [Nitrospirae bacterium]|nr:DUF1801 domain-containing protein [Nitrospirota bacterium]
MDQSVKQFLDDLEAFMPEKAKIIIALRKIVLQVIPEATEVMMYGGIVYKTNRLLCGLFARKNHITVEFEKEREIDDPYLILEGKGKERRHIKISTYEDIKEKKIRYYIDKSCHL